MTQNLPSARITTPRIHWAPIVGLIVVIAAITAITAVLGYQVPKFSSSPAGPPSSLAGPPLDTGHGGHERADRKAGPGEADGAVPDGVTVFDDGYPGVANLDAELLRAVREAARDAADDGVTFYVNSGWRSPKRQNQLLREAVSKYGSEEQAARWVATPSTSPHVSGDAIDLGRSDATAWLSEHGAEYGLCQIYGNEPWHYELRANAIDHGCPRRYADPTQDPRMRQ